MNLQGNSGMGRFSVDFLVANYEDMALARRGMLPKDQVRSQIFSGLVDCGATKLILPGSLVKELGLPIGGKMKVQYADGRKAVRRVADGAYVEIQGRHGTFSAIVENNRQTALIGAIVLEDLDLLVDCHGQCLIPRHKEGPVFEI